MTGKMKIEIRTDGRRAVLTVRSSLSEDRLDVEELVRAFDGLLLQGFTDFALDLEDGPYIDSYLLGSLVRILTMITRKGGHLRFIGSSRLKELLKLTGLWKEPD